MLQKCASLTATWPAPGSLSCIFSPGGSSVLLGAAAGRCPADIAISPPGPGCSLWVVGAVGRDGSLVVRPRARRARERRRRQLFYRSSGLQWGGLAGCTECSAGAVHHCRADRAAETGGTGWRGGQGVVLQVAGCCRDFQLQSGDSVQDRVCGRGPGALQHCRLQSGLGPGRPSVLAPHCSLQSADPLVCCWARAS